MQLSHPNGQTVPMQLGSLQLKAHFDCVALHWFFWKPCACPSTKLNTKGSQRDGIFNRRRQCNSATVVWPHSPKLLAHFMYCRLFPKNTNYGTIDNYSCKQAPSKITVPRICIIYYSITDIADPAVIKPSPIRGGTAMLHQPTLLHPHQSMQRHLCDIHCQGHGHESASPHLCY